VLKFEEVFEDPQILHNKTLIGLNHPEAGAYKVANNPIQMSRTPARPSRYAPRLGEDNEPVLRELGYSEDEIEDFIKRGIIGKSSATEAQGGHAND
jgi:formyl-CoA transferase